VHWLNSPPEHDAQSGWQVVHWSPDEERNVAVGHEDTQRPAVASWLLEQVKHVVAEPRHVLQDESQAVAAPSQSRVWGSGKRILTLTGLEIGAEEGTVGTCVNAFTAEQESARDTLCALPCVDG
jgi:hypothetical protein